MKWTDNELNILRDNYYIISPAELSRLIPRHTWGAITAKVFYLRKRGWAFKGRFKKP